MGTRSDELASRFEDAIKEFDQTIQSCSDEQWRATCGDEGWSVAATAHHVAGQFPLEREYISAVADGREMPALTWDDINGKNERHAAEHTSCDKAEVLRLLRARAGSMASYIRDLSDEQLDRTAGLPLADGASVSTQQLIEGGVLIDHVQGHMRSIRSAG
jgi:DinB superfamily